MRVVIASDADGMSMKESIKEMLIADGHEVVDYSETPCRGLCRFRDRRCQGPAGAQGFPGLRIR